MDCWFRAAHQERRAEVFRWSQACDAALLRLDEAPDGVEPLVLDPPVGEVAEWQGYAFPGFARERAVTLDGRMSDLDDFDTEGRPAIR